MINRTENTSPIWLPQINEEDKEQLLKELSDMGVIVKKVMVSPKHLKPLQKSVKKSKIDAFNEAIDNDEDLPETWIDADNNILDGHHRGYTYQSRPDIEKSECFKVFLKTEDACRIINKILDRLEFKKEYNINDDKYNISDYKEFVLGNSDEDENHEDDEESEIEPETKSNAKEIDSKQQLKDDEPDAEVNFDSLGNQVLKVYSVKKINPKAPTGVLTNLAQTGGFVNEYEIQFDKILEIPNEEMDLYDPFYLAAVYTLNDGFETDRNAIIKAASTAGMNLSEFAKSKANQFAKQQGYDGINFGQKYMLIITG